MPDRFPESDTENTPEYECLHEAWKIRKQPSDTIPCQNNFITSIIFVVFFAKQTINLTCIEAILLSKRGLGAFCIGLRCLHVKQNGTDCTRSIFVPLADAEQSCTELLEHSVSDSYRAV